MQRIPTCTILQCMFTVYIQASHVQVTIILYYYRHYGFNMLHARYSHSPAPDPPAPGCMYVLGTVVSTCCMHDTVIPPPLTRRPLDACMYIHGTWMALIREVTIISYVPCTRTRVLSLTPILMCIYLCDANSYFPTGRASLEEIRPTRFEKSASSPDKPI
jgi:hypothetical protein